MSVEETERTVRAYLEALLQGGDFGAFFAEDVVWTTMETGEQVRGRQAVTDFIVALHSEMFDAAPELRSLAFADGVAALEAVFAARHIADLRGPGHRRVGPSPLLGVLRPLRRRDHRAARVLPDPGTGRDA